MIACHVHVITSSAIWFELSDQSDPMKVRNPSHIYLQTQGFHSESKVWVWDYDIHTAHLLTKTDCRQSGRRWEQLQVGKSEKCDHTFNPPPALSWVGIPPSDDKMPRVYHARHEQAKRLTRENAAGCLHKLRVTLLVHAIPIMQSINSSLRFGMEWRVKTNQNIRGFPYTPPSSIFCTALPHLQNYSRCRCGRNKQNRVATAV